MVHYHSHTRIIGRSGGRSAVAAAAYRAGEKLRNDFEGGISDFSRRSGVIHTEIMAPEQASPWTYDREELWNRAEATERRKDAQLAREVELALPHELSDDQRLALLRGYVRQQFVSRGMVADIAIHQGHSDERNVHAHVMLTMRALLPEGFGNKVTEWNDPRNVKHWRREWARQQNRAYREVGLGHMVDDRSYREQGIKRRAQIHEGVKGRRMKARSYQPRSRVVERCSFKGIPRTLDYRRIDQGRTRAQRNAQIVYANRVQAHSGAPMARLVEAHLHRRQLHSTWQAARKAGKALREAGKAARRARWQAERAAEIVQVHQERLRSLAQFAARMPGYSEVMVALIVARQGKLGRARNRAVARAALARREEAAARKAAVQYRNLKSRLGNRQSSVIRAQVDQAHRAALRQVSPAEIFNSPLSESQKRDLVAAWRWAQRERGRSTRDR